MRHATYILRNARRNPVRSTLAIASSGICLFLMMMLQSFFAIRDEMTGSWRIHNRLVTLNANGFAGMVPISCVAEISRLDGVVAVTPFCWFGGKYQDEVLPFAQFGVDPDRVFTVRDEFTIALDQLSAFQQNRDGCVIGRKLAEERCLKVGDPLPLRGEVYPVDLNLTVRGIYDGPADRNSRMCLFRWDYFDEAIKRISVRCASDSESSALIGRISGNAGMIFIKCKSPDALASLSKQIDDLYRNSDSPTRTQTEEAFAKIFGEMLGDLKGMMGVITLAVLFSFVCVTGNAMAMSMRERTAEVALLRAIGFDNRRVLFIVIGEAMLVAGIGGAIGSLGCKALCEIVDFSRFGGGAIPFFYIPWSIALQGLAVALVLGFASGIVPAFRATNLSVIDGLRKID
jgi:putative ABC transport system permease protein